MPRIERSATVSWEGNVARGAGFLGGDTGSFTDVPFSLPSRLNAESGKTSPEELLAAAHSSCFCMALSLELADAGTPPERLEATATVEFVAGEGVTSSHIDVKGRVPGIDADAFAAAARNAGEGCPISGALKGNVDITVDATLET